VLIIKQKESTLLAKLAFLALKRCVMNIIIFHLPYDSYINLKQRAQIHLEHVIIVILVNAIFFTVIRALKEFPCFICTRSCTQNKGTNKGIPFFKLFPRFLYKVFTRETREFPCFLKQGNTLFPCLLKG
jgi:hypothetical protein